ncbi:hypothetical protein OO015_01465 [Thermomicrobium sp. 4228-Ro]|uniref:hypothetical protein n=1 Tax=Thermomicrobium sp. 4228-Ro TaxID=2993937 RepID=UPI0022497DAE|nr:hypothetical protein [Thermomicrobium sp. 4228-Ro]MCX2726170.1 hypothetical protein [Thermomicrobium sp. 4228-Ro]
MEWTHSEVIRAFLLWLPGGTVLPFVVSRLTGADTRLAMIEAAIFALGSLLVYPTLLGLLSARFVQWQAAGAWVETLFLGGFALAALTIVVMRRATRRLQRGASTRRRANFRP